ncbi:Crp/Fnr family transcriptional regulator [Burkholderia singularis]|uniref:Crp/Fnr family transcriptional regulator n=1 Tax=Burkholderia singularis TaxID=1503053 RepID=A0A103E2K1_9BURK|nr:MULTISPECIES: Crp/Fnr family transcriptional regulator [Burkholderia]AOK30597.1 Crp/Fnr family transcriptional regulator [Burkholderia sp. Bp7605]KVE27010.1 Crp/Fnr family transcriptional regulator [Burkholderia singularis]SMG01766.1 cAMP-binding proteins-catabolite gene activator and regulatory subunit of cAMP-dependent protein kinases [Burkholderia singularis]
MTHREFKEPLARSGGVMIELPHRTDANRFIASLDAAERAALASHMQLVHVKSGQVLCEPGKPLEHVYLPVTTVISIQYASSDGMTLEIAEIGNEGIVSPQLVGSDSAIPCRVLTCRDGFAYRLSPRVLSNLLEESAQVRQTVFRYTYLLMTQAKQISFCSRHHVLKNQLCRWFLLAYDRSRSVEIQVTHSMLAQMLGVRRETVTDAAGEIQKMGLIRQYRSSIILADLPGLEAQSCGCHAIIRDEMKKILSAPAGTTTELRS